MFILAPFGVDVTMYRWPIANFLLIITITLVSVMALNSPTGDGFDLLVMRGMGLVGLFGHVFLHGGVLHLLGNMLFLWSFGNAVCAKLGNWIYFGLFFLLAALAGTAHIIFNGMPAIGASGAINGVVGLFLVFFPRNDVQVFWYFLIRWGTFSISAGWMILLWLGFDLWGLARGGEGVAYWAHIGGLAAGVGIGVLCLKRNWIRMTKTECSLLEVLGLDR